MIATGKGTSLCTILQMPEIQMLNPELINHKQYDRIDGLTEYKLCRIRELSFFMTVSSQSFA
jgi:hypothetical protein